jgi:hypothetical protein
MSQNDRESASWSVLHWKQKKISLVASSHNFLVNSLAKQQCLYVVSAQQSPTYGIRCVAS